MMCNKDVINKFLQLLPAMGSNLYSTGHSLINYSTCIAEWSDNCIYINITKYSKTTSKNQNLLRKSIPNNITCVYCDNVPIGKRTLNAYNYE